jgi:predicted aminopeptidase
VIARLKQVRVSVPVVFAAAVITVGTILLDGLYLLEQGAYAAHYTFSARPVEAVAEEGSLAAETRDFFNRVARIRRYAVEALGLAETDSYTSYVEIDRDYLVHVVSAARELSFERYRWNYPVLGALPYRGYYERPDAVAEAARIDEAGYDVLVRRVDAYSSLGVVPDPLYSFMREYSEYALAELIIHELAHATVFVPGMASFNEEFATLVGREGALSYLEERHGAGSEVYRSTVRRLRDRRVFLGFIAALRNRLIEVYESNRSADAKREAKRRIISDSKQTFSRFSDRWFLTDAYDWVPEADVDNAFIDLYATYNAGRMESYGDQSSMFQEVYERVGRSLPALIDAIKAAARTDDPRAALSESRGSARKLGDD